MDKLKIYLISILLILIGTSNYAQPYSYPTRPGDDLWKTFENPDEMYRACQIPNGALKSMTTQDLVTTCLSYPLINTLYAYNDLQAGFDALKKKFNGFEELVKRNDSGIELMKVYSKMLPSAFDQKWSIERKGRFTLEFSYIETLLAQRDIQLTLSSTAKRELVAVSLEKYKMKQTHVDIFGTHGTSNTVWVIARIVQNQNIGNLNNTSSDYEMAKYAFVEQGLVVDFKVIDDILDKAKAYIK